MNRALRSSGLRQLWWYDRTEGKRFFRFSEGIRFKLECKKQRFKRFNQKRTKQPVVPARSLHKPVQTIGPVLDKSDCVQVDKEPVKDGDCSLSAQKSHEIMRQTNESNFKSLQIKVTKLNENNIENIKLKHMLDEYKRQNFELNKLNAALENKSIEQQSYIDILLDDMALMNDIKSDLQSDIHCLNNQLKSNEELTKKLEEAEKEIKSLRRESNKAVKRMKPDPDCIIIED